MGKALRQGLQRRSSGYTQCCPGYDKGDLHIGRASYFCKGLVENGAVYNHGVAFKIAADCVLGEGEHAYQTLKLISCDNPKNSDSGVEPYAVTNMYIGPENPYLAGYAPASWITGTAGWIYRSVTEYLLGIKPTLNGLKIEPAIPSGWNGTSVSRKFRGETFNITYVESDKASLVCDGKETDILSLSGEGCVHNVICNYIKKVENKMETKKLAVIGYGQRGSIYANYALQNPEEFVVVAIVDNDEDRRKLAESKHDCPVFSDYRDFLKAGIAADIVAVATQDKDHREHAIACMEAGYDLLLEKPIATSPEDCEAIYECAVKNNRKVIVCHVLRYTPFYSKLKEVVDSGVLGDIVTMNTTECVGYYHQAHSFVRGPWRNSLESCPMILAKCCHDMDMIRYILGKKCLAVSSFGGLTHFTEANAPDGSADYCSDCKCTDCVYKSQTIYEREQFFRGYFTTDTSDDGNWREKLIHSPYDRCVYRCDNDVVDHQVCIFEFEGGTTVSHTMNAFSKEIYRDIKIHGTKAELVGNMEALYLELRPFGGDVIRYDFSDANTEGNHGGGDISMMHSLYLERNGEAAPGITYIDVSIDSHRMSFGAEKSRTSGGALVKI